MTQVKRALTLRVWFRLIAAGLVLLILAVVSRLVLLEWQQLEQAEQGRQATARLRLALVALEMVSRERGPANGVLGDQTPGRPALREALAEARARTDRAYAAFRPVLAEPGRGDVHHDQIRAQVDAFHAQLIQARARVDRHAAQPWAERQPEQIRDAVGGMVQLIPMLTPASSLMAEEALQAAPELAPLVSAARLAADLREYAGQLGSLFTPALARQQPFTQQELAAIERVRGRIDELRALLDMRVSLSAQSDAVVGAHAAMERGYFVAASQLLEGVLRNGREAGHFGGMTPADFAARYVPKMDAIVALRDALLGEADRRSVALEARARDSLVMVAMMTTVTMALVLLMLRVTHQRVVRPLSQAATALQAMSEGDHAAPALPQPLAQDEIAAVMGGILALQQQSKARAALERERDKLIDSLREQSTTDFLTSLPNRRAFFEAAEAELARARRHGFSLVLMLLDVDHFKRVNDTVGHAGGDQALVAVAQALRLRMRQGDLVARLGGEEFIALLSHCQPEDGLRFAERVREGIASQRIELGEGQPVLHLTVSVGLADSSTHGMVLDELMARADDALYKAKHAGRNRTEMAQALI